jgi:envelope integrity protein B
MLNRTGLTLVCAAVVAGTATVASPPPAEAAGVVLTPHRAIYDLRLLRTRGKKDIEAVRGRILYDFSGSPCAGYVLNFRQVSQLNSGENKTALSDLRATTWEEASAKRFKFSSENHLDDKTIDKVDGEAKRDADQVEVKLAQPKDKTFALEKAMVFPTEHMRRIIEAAQEGKTILELPVYDGSENGEKVYSTMTLIGREIAPNEKVPTDAAAGQAALATLKRWPVTISYFDRTDKKREEQTPVYSISFELYENGISRALSLDYEDFVIAGDMSQLEIKDPTPCK